MEIIKMDAELSQCPETGVRYFGYLKYTQKSGDTAWEAVHEFYDVPWFVSQESLIDWVQRNRKDDEKLQLIILKAELPIKKLVLNDG